MLNRNLLVFKGFGPNLSDEEYFNFCKKFGKQWTDQDFKDVAASTVGSVRPDQGYIDVPKDNEEYNKRFMGYHADLAHTPAKDRCYPGRSLYMKSNTTNGSGATTWLNLEHSWAQCTPEEKSQYNNIEVVNHNMYRVGERMETFPFLKINPKTGKASPRLNSIAMMNHKSGLRKLGWIHHFRVNGSSVSLEETRSIMFGLIGLLEKKTNALYDHHWDNGDIVIYDNWFNIHKRSAVDDSDVPGGRVLRRVTFDYS